MITFGKRFLSNRTRRLIEGKTETKDAVVTDILPVQRLAKVKIQGSEVEIVAHYPLNWQVTPTFLKKGNSVKINFVGGNRGRIELIGHGSAIPTVTTPAPTTPGDALLTGGSTFAQDPATMSVDVEAGTVRISGSTYPFGADSITLDAAPSAGYYRYDLLVVGADGVIDYVKGVQATSNPAVPSVPANHVEIRRILLYNGNTAIYHYNIGQIWTTPAPASLEISLSAAYMAWDIPGDHIHITATVLDQYGGEITPAQAGYVHYDVTLSWGSGNGKIDDIASPTPVTHEPTTASTDFIYTRNNLATDESPSFLIVVTNTPTAIQGQAEIILWDPNGDPMYGDNVGNVFGPASATTGDLASFADTSGKVLEDSGIPKASVISHLVNGPATWGAIDGTLENQADLVAILNTKADIGSGGAATGTFLASGGTVTWVSGYTYRIGAAVYYIEGTQHTSAEAEVTLDAADETYDRIDIIALNAAGALVKINGTPAAVPALPDLDPSLYCMVTFVYVSAATSEPPGIYTEDIYTEGVEWTVTPSAGTIVVDSTNNPRTGTKCIEGTAVVANTYFTAVRSASFTPSEVGTLIFFIRLKAAWPNQKNIRLSWYQGTVLVGSVIDIGNSYGFNRSLTGAYQQIAVPLSNFNIPAGTQADRLRFMITGSGSSVGFYLDDMSLQTGVVIDPTIILTTDTGTSINTVLAGENNKLVPAVGGTGITISGKTISLAERTFNLTLIPEYPGALMTPSGSNNDAGTLGMRSDFETISNIIYNYYRWASSIATGLQSMDLNVKIPIPDNFTGIPAGASVALTLQIKTEENTTTNNKLDVTIRKDGSATTSSLTDQKSSAAATWEVIGFDDSDTVLASLVVGDILNVTFRMYSQNSKYTRIGKLNLQTKQK